MKSSGPVILLAIICLLLGPALVLQNRAAPAASAVARPRTAKVPSDDELFTAPLPLPTPPRPATRPAALDRIVREVRFDRVPLRTALADIADSAKLSLVADWPRLQETTGVEPDTPITLHLFRVTHAQALAAVLRAAPVLAGPGLSYSVGANDVLHVVSAEVTPDVSVRFYDVRSLLRDSIAFSAALKALSPPRPTPAPRSPSTSPAGGGGLFGGGGPDDHLAPVEDAVVRELITDLKELIDRESWVDNGGRYGQVRYWAGRLIVSQTNENHRQIGELLGALGFGRAHPIP